jgi:hypothetical protein
MILVSVLILILVLVWVLVLVMNPILVLFLVSCFLLIAVWPKIKDVWDWLRRGPGRE